MGKLRIEIEAYPDVPTIPVAATEESYIAGTQSMSKHFLRALDAWTDFDDTKDWKESDLGSALFDRANLPAVIKDEATGNMVGVAAHAAYQAWKGN